MDLLSSITALRERLYLAIDKKQDPEIICEISEQLDRCMVLAYEADDVSTCRPSA